MFILCIIGYKNQTQLVGKNYHSKAYNASVTVQLSNWIIAFITKSVCENLD